jgi:hypothetical protein
MVTLTVFAQTIAYSSTFLALFESITSLRKMSTRDIVQ